MRRARRAGLVAVGLVIGASVLTVTPVAAKGHGHATVVLEGLSSPKGIVAGPDNSVFVSQGTFGPPGPVLHVDANGVATPITDPINLVDIAGTPDGAGWAIGGDGWLYRQATLGGAIEPILDIAAYQEGDPDPDDQDVPAFPEESNPYGLTGLPNNDVLIADAANNDVLRVSPNGDAVTVARWPRESIKTAKKSGLPKKLPAEAVPTSVTIGPDGWAYVGQLMGFPGTPGSAHIWRVNPWAEGATCQAKKKNADCKVWKSGFTSIIDLEFAPNGTLYVYEIAKAGWLALESCAPGDCPAAVLLEVKGKHRHELAKGKLSEPGGVVVTENGTVYVTDGMFSNGRLVRIK